MKFKELLIRKTSLPKDVHELFPLTYQAIGDICLIKTSDFVIKRYGYMIGGIVMDNLKQFRSVVARGKIKGKTRKPKIKWLAGDKNTETVHKDSGYKFKLDVANIMWSKGNHGYRQKLMKQVKPRDVVIDMFAGIGYWTVPIADKVKKVYAIDINPQAYDYLNQNVRLNRISNVMTIKGDCSKVKVPEKGNRIIMGLIPSAKEFIPCAIKMAKKGATIHYHGVAGEDGKELMKDWGRRKVKLLKVHKVKEYAPKRYHYVLDIKLP